MSDWDAETYHQLSGPQVAWGRRVLERLQPSSGERILDLGCGSGRLTTELASILRYGQIVGVDRSATMLAEAAEHLAGRKPPPGPRPAGSQDVRIHLVRADAASLPFVDAFDAVFSTATFHWVLDHDMLFSSIYRALAPGGRLVAQCGGGPNLSVLLGRAHRLMDERRFSRRFEGWNDPWSFADVPSTRLRLERAGFSAINVSLEPAPTSFPDAAAYTRFLSCVCVRHHVARLPPDEQPAFLQALARQAALDDPPFTLDYWRLNLAATKPAGEERAA